MCAMHKDSDKTAVLKSAVLIVWDECTMSHKKAFEAVDRTLRDVRSSDQLMGGVTVVSSGDFRQTLLVVPRGTPADEIMASLKSSFLWRYIQKFSLTANMPVALSGDESVGFFSDQLLQVGNGAVDVEASGEIVIPDTLAQISNCREELIKKIYPNMRANYRDPSWLKERAILAH